MTRSPRQAALSWLHTWIGLTCGWVLFLVFLTGSLTVFAPEIDAWMRPALRAQSRLSLSENAAAAQETLRRVAPDATSGWVILPGNEARLTRLIWWRGNARRSDYLSADGDSLLGVNPGAGAAFFKALHWRFDLAPSIGRWAVALPTFGLLLAIVTGVWIHRRRFADFFTWQRRAGASRQMRDLHTVGGMAALPFLTMIAYTGLVFSATVVFPAGVDDLYGGSRNRLSMEAFGLPPMSQRSKSSPKAVAWTSFAGIVARAEAEWGEGNVASLQFNRDGGSLRVVARQRDERRIALRQETLQFDGETGVPVQHRRPEGSGVRLHTLLTGLHAGHFGGDTVRWLYFLGGMIGAAVIGSGVVLFSLKRRELPSLPHGAIARVNLAATLGVLLAVAAFLWGSRLGCPLDDRALWERLIFWGPGWSPWGTPSSARTAPPGGNRRPARRFFAAACRSSTWRRAARRPPSPMPPLWG